MPGIMVRWRVRVTRAYPRKGGSHSISSSASWIGLSQWATMVTLFGLRPLYEVLCAAHHGGPKEHAVGMFPEESEAGRRSAQILRFYFDVIPWPNIFQIGFAMFWKLIFVSGCLEQGCLSLWQHHPPHPNFNSMQDPHCKISSICRAILYHLSTRVCSLVNSLLLENQTNVLLWPVWYCQD